MDIYDTSKDVVKELLASGTDVGVIGGWAIWAYNPYKYSMDIDIVLRPRGLWKVRERLSYLGFSETSGGHLGEKGFKKAVEGGAIEVDVYDGKIGPFTAEDVLERSLEKDLFGMRAKVASPTDLVILKVYALTERRGSGKGEKDISDIIALLLVVREDIEVDEVRRTVTKRDLKDAIALITSSYQQTSRFYPLKMDEYKKLKAALEKWMD
ncbi:MAG TPA: nucleotidyltransferase [Thermoplasmata archaeon]